MWMVMYFRFVTAYWKFLAVVTGIDAASSDYACIWCKCKKDERCDVTRQWSLTDTNCGARTIQENNGQHVKRSMYLMHPCSRLSH